MKFPPGLFSTTTVVFMLSANFCATSRAWTSVPPPGASPTIIRIGRLEKSCASAGASAASAPSKRPADPNRRPKNVMAFLPNFYGLMLASLVILV